ncbi:unnamed protein product [Musa acuminata var. zebrina]
MGSSGGGAVRGVGSVATAAMLREQWRDVSGADGGEEMERVTEDLIAGLPGEDQEIILRYWLEDFAASDSDWPNLSRFLNVNTMVKISVSMSKLSTYGVVDAIYTFSKYKTKRNTIAL